MKMTAMRIDFHTHILPGIDDGAADTETAVAMLRMMAEQQVDAVVATPHYFSLDHSPEEFCTYRTHAYETLMAAWRADAAASRLCAPRFLFGAEVYLTQDLQLTDGLERLQITGTDLMLLELPFSGFRDWMPWTIRSIAARLRVRPVIAHVERYLRLYDKKAIRQLLEIPSVMFQCNVSIVSDRAGLKFLSELLRNGYTVFFGSDCHDAQRRLPEFGTRLPQLRERISRKTDPALFDALLEAQSREIGL